MAVIPSEARQAWLAALLAMALGLQTALAQDGGIGAECDKRAVIFNRTSIPQDWRKVARAAGPQKMSFLLALRQAKGSTAKLEKAFWEVADPKSPRYQQFLTSAQIDQIVKTSSQDMGAIRKWLKAAGVPDYRMVARSDSMLVTANVEELEQIFATELYIYVHNSGHTIVRNFGAYSVPQCLKDVIILAEGITDFPMHRGDSRRHPESPSQVMVVPETLAELYKFRDVQVSSNAVQMPAEFQDDASFSPSDLKTFFAETALPAQQDSHRVGPFQDQYPDVEATLDTQYMLAVGLGATNWYWTSQGWMYTFANNLYNYEQAPNVVSMSWGWAEDQQCTVATDCSTLGVDSEQYVARTNVEFMKLGLKGVSLFASSGDSGANGRSDSDCTDSKLHAVFPASSPYVTAVGATMLQNAQTNLPSPPPVCTSGTYKGTCASSGTEVAVSFTQAGFTSGGGFSAYVAQPEYQKAAVSAYLQSGVELPPASYYAAGGRAYPDVAAMGNNFLVYINQEGGWSPVGGTSASSPTWAGIAARLVDISVNATGKPLGFMNPLLYQMYAEHPAAFVDVVTGDNRCTESGCSASCKGFEAAKGWDPVSGLGTPQYDQLSKYVESMLRSMAARRRAEPTTGTLLI